MSPDPTWTDVAGVTVLGLQLLVLIVAAIFARHQVGEAKRLREAQTRPFVVIDFEVERSLVFLTISNLGTTLARDVTFEIEPPLRSALGHEFLDLQVLREGAPTLAPGKTIRTLFDQSFRREPDEFPDRYAVKLRYADETKRRHFEESQVLDLGVYRNLSRVERRDVHDIHERLKETLNEMKKWTSGTGRGLLRLNPSDVQAHNERMARQIEERRSRQAEEAHLIDADDEADETTS